MIAMFNKKDNQTIATQFMLRAIQEWNQPEQERIDATQAFVKAAKFDAVVTSWPVFGGIIPKDFEGKDGAAATAWLREVLEGGTDHLPWRGKLEREIEYLAKALEARQ